MFIEKGNFSSALKYVLFTKKNIVVYDTYTFAFDDSVPSDIRDMVVDGLGELKLGDVRRFEFVEKKSDILLSKNQEEGMIELFSKNFIPVAHLYSLEDDISKDSLKKFNIFMLDSKYEKYLESQYSVDIEILESKEQLVEKLADSDKNIALVEFDDLDVDMKILDVDSKNFLDDENGSIPISFFAKLKNPEDLFIVDVVKKNVGSTDSKFNREKLVKVNMSGVVAISRGLALKMDSLKSTTYPADEIGEFLANADLTHVSNEVSFVPGCKVYSGMRFCSRPEYIDVLKKSGVDIVELTGNHNNDFGSKYSKESIKIYTDLGMRYFGGGLDDVDASKILYEEVKGTKIAFMGYNYYDTMLKTLALAGEERSGANSFSEEKMQSDIETARKNADIVIVDFQFQECYSYPSSDVIFPICYKPLSSPDQKGVFKKAIDMGADIVVGTQAHQPQTFELYKDGVIFYGLGNLFFDQSIWIGTRQGLVLSHYFYEGKHIQTNVVPIYMEKDLKVRLATESQGDLLMKLLKNAR